MRRLKALCGEDLGLLEVFGQTEAMSCYRFWADEWPEKVEGSRGTINYVGAPNPLLAATVLDPEGKAIQHSVELLGFSGIADVRQGKYFEIALDDSLDTQRARESVEKMAREVLSNPIIEDYRVEIEA